VISCAVVTVLYSYSAYTVFITLAVSSGYVLTK